MRSQTIRNGLDRQALPTEVAGICQDLDIQGHAAARVLGLTDVELFRWSHGAGGAKTPSPTLLLALQEIHGLMKLLCKPDEMSEFIRRPQSCLEMRAPLFLMLHEPDGVLRVRDAFAATAARTRRPAA